MFIERLTKEQIEKLCKTMEWPLDRYSIFNEYDIDVAKPYYPIYKKESSYPFEYFLSDHRTAKVLHICHMVDFFEGIASYDSYLTDYVSVYSHYGHNSITKKYQAQMAEFFPEYMQELEKQSDIKTKELRLELKKILNILFENRNSEIVPKEYITNDTIRPAIYKVCAKIYEGANVNGYFDEERKITFLDIALKMKSKLLAEELDKYGAVTQKQLSQEM